MNKKQVFVLLLGLVAIGLIVYFTPRYKITWIDSNNFIRTEQTSSLYKRSKGAERLYWDKILIYSGMTMLACATLIFALRKTNGKNNL